MMGVYLGIFRIRFIAGLQYRAAAWAGVATQLAFGFMYLMIYSAFYKSSPGAAPMDFSALASYVWLQQALLNMTMLWRQDNELLSAIQSGAAAYELARPYRIYPVWAARLLALRLSGTVLRFLPVVMIGALLPAPWNLSAPAGFGSGRCSRYHSRSRRV